MSQRAVMVLRGGVPSEVRIAGASGTRVEAVASGSASRELARLAHEIETGTVAWVEESLLPFVTPPEEWGSRLRHRLQVLHLGGLQRTDLEVGSFARVDFDSPYLLAAPEDRCFPTWLIASCGGVADAEALRRVPFDPTLGRFPLALFDFGSRGSRLGLCGTSEPRLLASRPPVEVVSSLRRRMASGDIARLVRRRSGRRWVAFWLAAEIWFSRRLPLAAAVRGLTAGRGPGPMADALEPIRPTLRSGRISDSVDIVIPTLDRDPQLRDVLEDLDAQTVRPRRAIVVDQGGSEDEVSAAGARDRRGYEVDRVRVPWVGACAARNLALERVDADWILLLDDDVRLPGLLIESLIRIADAYGVEVVMAAVHHPSEPPPGGPVRPWPALGTCACLVSREAARRVAGFDLRLEGGFGEDYDYGVRLRLAGHEVLVAAHDSVVHLKAPRGGFRTPFRHPWSHEAVPPKPSPTVLLSRRKHHSRYMQEGYQLYYLAGRVRAAGVWHLWSELRSMGKEWRVATAWCGRLLQQGESQSAGEARASGAR